MRNEHLIAAARERANLIATGGNLVTDKIIKETFGLDPRIKGSTSSYKDQIFNLIDKALAKSLGYHSAGVADMHPIDEAFIILESAVKLSTDEKNRKDNLKQSGKFDQVNNIIEESYGSSENSGNGKYSANDLFNFISEVFDRCPNGKTITGSDPVNEYIKNAFGDGRLPEQPKHALSEWNILLEGATGFNPESDILARSEDFVNDFAAKATGQKPPSEKALDIIMGKVMDTAYQLSKLTPGSEAYEIKNEELKQLQIAKEKREDNLKELNN